MDERGVHACVRHARVDQSEQIAKRNDPQSGNIGGIREPVCGTAGLQRNEEQLVKGEHDHIDESPSIACPTYGARHPWPHPEILLRTRERPEGALLELTAQPPEREVPSDPFLVLRATQGSPVSITELTICGSSEPPPLSRGSRALPEFRK